MENRLPDASSSSSSSSSSSPSPPSAEDRFTLQLKTTWSARNEIVRLGINKANAWFMRVTRAQAPNTYVQCHALITDVSRMARKNFHLAKQLVEKHGRGFLTRSDMCDIPALVCHVFLLRVLVTYDQVIPLSHMMLMTNPKKLMAYITNMVRCCHDITVSKRDEALRFAQLAGGRRGCGHDFLDSICKRTKAVADRFRALRVTNLFASRDDQIPGGIAYFRHVLSQCPKP